MSQAERVELAGMVLTLAAVAAMIVGLWMLSSAAALIVGGLWLSVVGVLTVRKAQRMERAE